MIAIIHVIKGVRFNVSRNLYKTSCKRMDILKPQLVWIEDRCYRFCDSGVWSDQDCGPYQEEYNQEEDDMTTEASTDDIQIETTSDGKYQHSVVVPKLFHKFLVGYEGKTKKGIEADTDTTMKIPKIGVKVENIEIIGSTRAGVISCRQRIDLLVESSKKKAPFTHFVSIPLNNEELINSFKKFKKDVLTKPELASNDIIEDFFINADKIHLTIGMLRLFDAKEKADAAETLKVCAKEIIEPMLEKDKPLEIVIQGLEIMNDDQSKVNVLYADVLKNDKLQEMADKVFEYFINKGMMNVQHSNKVNLHMTLMKTSRVRKRNYTNQLRLNSFDATKILSEYKDYYFGKSELKTISIADRIAEAPNGHYKSLIDIHLHE